MRMYSECGKIEIDSLEIEYKITRKNVKNINFKVESDGTLRISANPYVEEFYIRKMILKNSAFIKKALLSIGGKKHIGLDEKTLFSGEEIYFLGDKLILEFKEGKDSAFLDENNILHIYENVQNHIETRKKAIEEFLNSRLADILQKLCDETFENSCFNEIKMPQIKMKTMKSRWGSCNISKNVITFNTKLIFLPFDFIKYVVIHEFCHLLVFNHSKEFYSCVEKIMPDYKTAKLIAKEFVQ